MFAKNSCELYPGSNGQAYTSSCMGPALRPAPVSVPGLLPKISLEALMADITKEEVEALVAKSVEKAISGILMVAITETVHCAVTQAMKDYKHECLLDLDEKELEAMQTMVDVVKSTGHGNIIAGVEEIRENHTFVVRLRKKCEKAGETMTQTLIKGVTGAIMLAIAVGAAYLLLKQTGNGGS